MKNVSSATHFFPSFRQLFLFDVRKSIMCISSKLLSTMFLCTLVWLVKMACGDFLQCSVCPEWFNPISSALRGAGWKPCLCFETWDPASGCSTKVFLVFFRIFVHEFCDFLLVGHRHSGRSHLETSATESLLFFGRVGYSPSFCSHAKWESSNNSVIEFRSPGKEMDWMKASVLVESSNWPITLEY